MTRVLSRATVPTDTTALFVRAVTCTGIFGLVWYSHRHMAVQSSQSNRKHGKVMRPRFRRDYGIKWKQAKGKKFCLLRAERNSARKKRYAKGRWNRMWWTVLQYFFSFLWWFLSSSGTYMIGIDNPCRNREILIPIHKIVHTSSWT